MRRRVYLRGTTQFNGIKAVLLKRYGIKKSDISFLLTAEDPVRAYFPKDFGRLLQRRVLRLAFDRLAPTGGSLNQQDKRLLFPVIVILKYY